MRIIKNKNHPEVAFKWVVTYTACPLGKTYPDSQNFRSDGAKL